MLDKLSLTQESDEINANKSFKAIFAQLETIIDLVFCSNLRINNDKIKLGGLDNIQKQIHGEIVKDTIYPSIRRMS